MSSLVLEQVLNGLQLGVMLFMIAAGLTLVFGVMGVLNLAHGALYMCGAFAAAFVAAETGSVPLGILAALPVAALLGFVIERLVISRLYARDHLDQVLATFGIVLFANEMVRILFGPRPLFLDVPAFAAGTVEVLPGTPYPAWRLAIILAGYGWGRFPGGRFLFCRGEPSTAKDQRACLHKWGTADSFWLRGTFRFSASSRHASPRRRTGRPSSAPSPFLPP